ncbi:MAG: cell division protein FtsW [Methylothermaceae bacteria B42]|nr:MAG: cell division protein FtsW [Methylothermaceae bacteria B42]HHJ38073.1 putative lipid II flippase FtsW [Methylothermaceae bacterium]
MAVPAWEIPVGKRYALDALLLSAVLLLLVFGYVMMTSASLHLHSDGFYYAKRQLIHILLGLMAGGAVMSVPSELWLKAGPLLLLIGFLLLVAVLIPHLGVSVNGSTRWLHVGGIRIQVSELYKWMAIVYMAGYGVRHGQALRTTAIGALKPLALLGIGAALLLLEPDFGATVILMATAVGMIFLAGAPLLPLLGLLTALIGAGVGLVMFKSYRLERIVGFLHPWEHAQDSAYQLFQALIAFARGGWFGAGLGNSVQKMFYLPEGHTDFLLAVIGEELGWIGVTLVITAYGVLLWRIFVVAKLADSAGLTFGALLVYGVGLWLGLQAIINMGVNLGVLPTKGLTLPLMSYGGGSLVVDCMALGAVLRVYAEARDRQASQPKRKAWRARS